MKNCWFGHKVHLGALSRRWSKRLNRDKNHDEISEAQRPYLVLKFNVQKEAESQPKPMNASVDLTNINNTLLFNCSLFIIMI